MSNLKVSQQSILAKCLSPKKDHIPLYVVKSAIIPSNDIEIMYGKKLKQNEDYIDDVIKNYYL